MYVIDEVFAKLKKNYDSVKKEEYCGEFEKMNDVMGEHIALISAETALVFSKLLMKCCIEHAQKTATMVNLPSDFSKQFALHIFRLIVKLMESSVHTKICIKSYEDAKKEFIKKIKNLKSPIVDSEGVEGFKDMMKKI